jgi:hypothetical protein
MEPRCYLDPKLQILCEILSSISPVLQLFINNEYSGARETEFTGHGVWAHDAHVVMQAVSHLKLISMALLQTSGYVTEQMQTKVDIDVNMFLGSFSIDVNGSRIHPPSWTTSEHNSGAIIQPQPIPQASTSTLANTNFNMEDYRICRQEEAVRWINLQERRSSIMARLQPTTAEEYQILRDAVTSESGPLRRTVKKQPGMKRSCTKYFSSRTPYPYYSH